MLICIFIFSGRSKNQYIARILGSVLNLVQFGSSQGGVWEGICNGFNCHRTLCKLKRCDARPPADGLFQQGMMMDMLANAIPNWDRHFWSKGNQHVPIFTLWHINTYYVCLKTGLFHLDGHFTGNCSPFSATIVWLILLVISSHIFILSSYILSISDISHYIPLKWLFSCIFMFILLGKTTQRDGCWSSKPYFPNWSTDILIVMAPKHD